MSKVKVKIEKIAYYNTQNHFCVMDTRIIINDEIYKKDNQTIMQELSCEYVTISCVMLEKPKKNESYIFDGSIAKTKYGLQFKADSYTEDIQSRNGLISYLSSGEFKGVGTKLARKIYNTLGDNLIEIISNDINALDKVEGLNSDLKTTIYSKIKADSINQHTISKLMQLGLTHAFSLKILEQMGEDCYYLIKENPYCLISEVDNVGFTKADEIAINKLNMSKDNPIRIEALIVHCLTTLTYQTSNSYIPKADLFNQVIKQTEISKSLFESSLVKLSYDKMLYIDNNDNVYDYLIYKAENVISLKIKRILELEKPNIKNLDEAINESQKFHNIELNTEQYEAVKNSLTENISIITGGPGTGKSTIVKCILQAFEYIFGEGYLETEVELLAPTGKASKKLNEITLHRSQTIHRFLGYKGQNIYEYGFGKIRLCKLVIIDESSMIDTVLFARLLTALEDDTKIVIVGDKDQLPSVSPGRVLHDLIKSEVIKTTTLTKILRQAQTSTIVKFSHDINNGIIDDDTFKKTIDRSFIALNDEQIVDTIVKIYQKSMISNNDTLSDIQVLAPMYKGIIGIDEINSKIQDAINPFDTYQVNHYSRHFREGDKVMHLTNSPEKKVMNGETGIIEYIDYDTDGFNMLTVKYDTCSVDYTFEELKDITLAYCISIHKAQGQEYKTVIMPLSFKYYVMLNRKLIYTAITRAKKFLVLLGNPKALEYASKKNDEKRLSNLDQRIQKTINDSLYIDDSKSAFDKVYSLDKSPYDFM